jgi:hypothetical protein
VTQIIDDRLLGAVLRGGAPPKRRADVFTTGCFYVRLCQAVLSSSAKGVLSIPLDALPPSTRDRALAALLQLPDEIGLVSLRELAPLIVQLRARHDLNNLGMEVLAAAVHLDAAVYLSAHSPRLEESLERESRRVQIVGWTRSLLD